VAEAVQGKYLGAVAGTTIAPAGSAVRLIGVAVTTAVATSVITIYKGTSTSGTVLAVIDGNVPNTYDFEGIVCNEGLYVDVTVAAAKATVIYA